MIRIVKLSGKLYGKKIASVDADIDNINTFVGEGTPVIIVEDLDDLVAFGIRFDSVNMVESN